MKKGKTKELDWKNKEDEGLKEKGLNKMEDEKRIKKNH